MSIDLKIKNAFEIADDGMQGVLGYFHYVVTCQNLSDRNEIQNNLPNYSPIGERHSIRITNDWVRYYSPEELIDAMDNIFIFYHSRISLISIISIFEGLLSSFVDRLVETNNIQPLRNNFYKTKLDWAFSQMPSNVSDRDKKLNYFLLIDHARRIRNLWMHNRGLFENLYETDVISIDVKSPIIDPLFLKYKQNQKPTPCLLTPENFEKHCLAHIDVLHLLHYWVQKQYFDNNYEGYSYVGELKTIVWHRLLTGT